MIRQIRLLRLGVVMAKRALGETVERRLKVLAAELGLRPEMVAS